MIIMTLPKPIAKRRPRPSDTAATNGKARMAPAEYIADITPRSVDLGEW